MNGDPGGDKTPQDLGQPTIGGNSATSGGGFNPAGVAVAGGGAILNWLGGQSTNDANSAQAALNRQFAADEAQKSRDWSQRMSGYGMEEKKYFRDTAYQATMADMKAAGLNPILAAQQGPTGTGSSSGMGGGQASAPANAQMQNAVGQGMNSGIAGASLMNDLRSTDADITMKQAQTLNAAASAMSSSSNARQTDEQTAQLVARRDENKAEALRDTGDATWQDANRTARMLTSQAGVGSAIINSAKAGDKLLLKMIGPGAPQPWEQKRMNIDPFENMRLRAAGKRGEPTQ